MTFGEVADTLFNVAPNLVVIIGVLWVVGREFQRVIDRVLEANEKQLDAILSLCNRRCSDDVPTPPG